MSLTRTLSALEKNIDSVFLRKSCIFKTREEDELSETSTENQSPRRDWPIIYQCFELHKSHYSKLEMTYNDFEAACKSTPSICSAFFLGNIRQGVFIVKYIFDDRIEKLMKDTTFRGMLIKRVQVTHCEKVSSYFNIIKRNIELTNYYLSENTNGYNKEKINEIKENNESMQQNLDNLEAYLIHASWNGG
jgi:hypothetical protein